MLLTKKYYDLVTDQGEAFIGYAVALKILGITLHWRSLFFWNGEEHLQQGIGRANNIESDHHLGLQITDFNLHGSWKRSRETEPQHLLDNGNLNIVWQGESIATEGEIMLADQFYRGTGYVETMQMAFKRPNIPFNTLYWGRFIADDRSTHLVWIQFSGAHDQTLIMAENQNYEAGDISKDRIQFKGGDLMLNQHQTLLNNPISRHVPKWLQFCLPGDMVQGQEEKWLSRGSYLDSTGITHSGSVIHERVTW